jgi:hypothetical protein
MWGVGCQQQELRLIALRLTRCDPLFEARPSARPGEPHGHGTNLCPRDRGRPDHNIFRWRLDRNSLSNQPIFLSTRPCGLPAPNCGLPAPNSCFGERDHVPHHLPICQTPTTGVLLEVIEAILNHISGHGGIAGVDTAPLQTDGSGVVHRWYNAMPCECSGSTARHSSC